jgi:dihydrodipicolinate synthase/N-acetylneuraminate lyase
MSAAPQGLICPVITPLHPDGKVNGAAFAALLERMAPHLDGVFVLGSCGENPWLSDLAQDEVVRVAVDTLGGRLALYVGVGQPDLTRVLGRIDERAESGADYLVATPPTFLPLTQTEIIDYYRVVADESALPVVLYNIPQFAGNGISAAAARELADHPNIVGIKDSSGDFELFQQLLLDRPAGFSVLQGRETHAAASVALGADGLVASLLNFSAPLMRQVFDAARKGDQERAIELQREITALATLADHGGLIPALKAAVELCGLPAGPPLRPLHPASEAQRAAINTLLESSRTHGWLN